jgi:hypothetical protein
LPIVGRKPETLEASNDAILREQPSASGKADYLSCRYISMTWDLDEIERDWKGKDSHPKCPRQQIYYPSVDPEFLKFNPSCDHGGQSCHMHE